MKENKGISLKKPCLNRKAFSLIGCLNYVLVFSLIFQCAPPPPEAPPRKKKPFELESNLDRDDDDEIRAATSDEVWAPNVERKFDPSIIIVTQLRGMTRQRQDGSMGHIVNFVSHGASDWVEYELCPTVKQCTTPEDSNDSNAPEECEEGCKRGTTESQRLLLPPLRANTDGTPVRVKLTLRACIDIVKSETGETCGPPDSLMYQSYAAVDPEILKAYNDWQGAGIQIDMAVDQRWKYMDKWIKESEDCQADSVEAQNQLAGVVKAMSAVRNLPKSAVKSLYKNEETAAEAAEDVSEALVWSRNALAKVFGTACDEMEKAGRNVVGTGGDGAPVCKFLSGMASMMGGAMSPEEAVGKIGSAITTLNNPGGAVARQCEQVKKLAMQEQNFQLVVDNARVRLVSAYERLKELGEVE